MKNFKTLYSSTPQASLAVQELKEQLGSFDAKLIVYFGTVKLEPQALSEEIHKQFQGIQSIGCTTSGEIVTGKMLDDSLVAMAFSKEMIADMKIEVITNIKEDETAVNKAFGSFEKHFDSPMSQLNPEKHVGIVLIDGLCGCEEKINERIGDLTNVTFIGGSAGDDLKFKSTYVYANGKAHTNAAVLLLLKPTVKFSILKTQSFLPTGKVLKVTKTIEESREVIELNNKPAVQAYAEALEVSPEKLGDYLFKNPLGLMFGDSPFVRSPRVIENNSILFYCSVKEGMELALLKSTDIIKDTAQAIADKKQELGGISGIINFNCILRTLDLKQQNRTGEYGELFEEIPTVGLSTYGESYIGHINQTATMLVFADK